MSSPVPFDQSGFPEALQVPSHSVDMEADLLSHLLGAGFALELTKQLKQSGPSRLSKHIARRRARNLHVWEFYTASLCKASGLC